MTKKHFAHIAEVVAMMNLTIEQRMIVAKEMAYFCKHYNSNFDQFKFMDAITSQIKRFEQ